MAKFLILYSSELSASELMASASKEEMQASMAEWIQWKEETEKTANFEFGLPLQAVSRIKPDGPTESDSHISGYSIIETGSKEEAGELLKNHPHLKRKGAWIDVLEMLPMPGMNA